MAKVKIPDFMVPSYKLTVNNTEYSYKAGSEADVPDNVADIIKNNNDMLPREDPPKPGMSGLDHTVTFRDDEGNPVAIYSVKDGVGNICAPSGVSAYRWLDADGNAVTFPVNPSADMVIAADNNVKYAERLYNKYSINPEEYPIIVLPVGYNNTQIRIDLHFCKEVYTAGSSFDIFYAPGNRKVIFDNATNALTMGLNEVIDFIIGSDKQLGKPADGNIGRAPRIFTHGIDVVTYPKCTDMDSQ